MTLQVSIQIRATLFVLLFTGLGEACFGQFTCPNPPMVVGQGGGADVSMAVINGQPAIAYNSIEPESEGAVYSVFDGQDWQVRHTIAEATSWVSLAEINGQPAIAYKSIESGSTGLWYTRFNGMTWESVVVEEDTDGEYPFTGDFCHLVQIAGEPAIAFRDESNRLKYARWNGARWVVALVVADISSDSSRILSMCNFQERPGIAYADESGNQLRWIVLDPITSIWNVAYVSTDAAESIECSVIDGIPTIAYKKSSPDALRFATRASGHWGFSTVDITAGDAADVALTSLGGRPAISYHNETHSNLRYAVFDGSFWHVFAPDLQIDTGNQVASVAFEGELLIAYYRSNPNRVQLVCAPMPSVFEIDSDGDGVVDATDVCTGTPMGTLVDERGRPIGDLDGDCRQDLTDYQIFQAGFTGP